MIDQVHDTRLCGGANLCRECQAKVRQRYPRFPIQNVYDDKHRHPPSVPWRLAELAYPIYAANGGRGQSLERLAERGGFGWVEFACFYAGHCQFFAASYKESDHDRCRDAALLAVEKDAVAAERRRIAGLIQDAASRAFLPTEPVDAIRRELLALREQVLTLEDVEVGC